MVIVLLVGSPGCGQHEFADFLRKNFKFNIRQINLYDLDYNLHEDTIEIDKLKKSLIQASKDIAEVIHEEWKENHVVFPILIPEQLGPLCKRAYATVVQIKAPLIKRYQRFCEYFKETEKPSLEKFIKFDDFWNFSVGIEKCKDKAELSLSYTDKIEEIYQIVQKTPLFKENKFRPDWDLYFMKVAYVVKQRTNCMKRGVGAVIVKNNRIISTGYNGTPIGLRNCFEGGCERCNSNTKAGHGLDQCNCFHAEESAILETGINETEGGSIYTTLFPCLWCAKIILQAKLKRVIYDEMYVMEHCEEYLRSSGVEIKQVKIKSAQAMFL